MNNLLLLIIGSRPMTWNNLLEKVLCWESKACTAEQPSHSEQKCLDERSLGSSLCPESIAHFPASFQGYDEDKMAEQVWKGFSSQSSLLSKVVPKILIRFTPDCLNVRKKNKKSSKGECRMSNVRDFSILVGVSSSAKTWACTVGPEAAHGPGF